MFSFVCTPEKSLCSFLVLDVEIFKLICILLCWNHSQEFFQVLLLKILFGQVLKISLGKWNFWFYCNWFFVHLNSDIFSEISFLVFNFNILWQEWFEVFQNNNIIFNWQFTVNEIFDSCFLSCFGSGFCFNNLFWHFSSLLIINYNDFI